MHDWVWFPVSLSCRGERARYFSSCVALGEFCELVGMLRLRGKARFAHLSASLSMTKLSFLLRADAKTFLDASDSIRGILIGTTTKLGTLRSNSPNFRTTCDTVFLHFFAEED